MYAFQAWFLLYVWNGGVFCGKRSVWTRNRRAQYRRWLIRVSDDVGVCMQARTAGFARDAQARLAWKKRTSDSAEVRELPEE